MPGPRKNLTPLDMKMMGLAFNQGGVINFLGKQPEVTAPVRAQSHADSPPVQLAYITDAEKDLLVKSNIHGSMDGKPNPGPAGLPSLDDFFTTPGGGIAGGSGEQVFSSGVDSGQQSTGNEPGGGGYQSSEAYGIQPGMGVSDKGQVFVSPLSAGEGEDQVNKFVYVGGPKQLELEELAAKKRAENLAKLGVDTAQEQQDTLLGRIKTKIMGGGEGGDLDLTKEEAYASLPAGMHPLRKQYEYLAKKYGDKWKDTTQAKVLESYLSGVPVERGGGLGARDKTYGGGEFAKLDQFGKPIDPEQFEVAEKFRQQLLNSMGLAGSDIGGMNTMGTVAEQLGALSDADYNKLRYGLSPEQFFNFNQQLMAADPSAGNEAYKAARPFSSGAGLGALADKVFPGANIFGALTGGLFPERDLTGYQQNIDPISVGFQPLPSPDPGSNPSGFFERKTRPPFEVPLPDPSDPKDPRYPFPIRPPFMPGFPTGIETVFNPMFLGPSFRGSPYTNRGVSPAFYQALTNFPGMA
jgi:hypothetical protein